MKLSYNCNALDDVALLVMVLYIALIAYFESKPTFKEQDE